MNIGRIVKKQVLMGMIEDLDTRINYYRKINSVIAFDIARDERESLIRRHRELSGVYEVVDEKTFEVSTIYIDPTTQEGGE